MAQQGGRIDFQVGFKTDKSGIEDLKKSLQEIQKIKPANFTGTKEDLRDIKNTAADVEAALSKAFNPNINSINLKTFDNELKTSHRSIEDIYASFSKAGAQGQIAFSQMARSILTTNQQLKQTHSLINQMGTTMVNTVKWGIASSVMNTFTSSVQGAFTYVESLEKSLTNIRIVTGDSQQKMEQFADSANRAAQELGRSTMDYSKAALTFYQQGLNDQDVQARTEAVLKAQNITGAGSQMADYLTAVWNGYKVANEQAQLYVDKLAAVADSSASDMSQLAIAMSKVASTANNMGVDVDQLNAQIATVVATTRQAPQAVGTAFKTIYTRMNDIKTGSDEAEISLGNYSGKMAELGFNVLDATGHLRDTGQVMQEIGARWGDLTKEQQIYLATTMGGQRQVNQLIALFDNWTTYSELLNTSLESEGTLVEKNGRYMESLGAKMEQLGAAGERVKASLIDSESFGNVIDLLTAGTNLLGGFIESIGGGGTALLGLGGIATQVFSGVLTKQISAAVTNMQNLQYNEALYNVELEKTKELAEKKGFGIEEVEQLARRKAEIQDYYSVMSEGDKQAYNDLLLRIGQIQTENRERQKTIDLSKQYIDSLKDKFNDVPEFDVDKQLRWIQRLSQDGQNALEKIRNTSSAKLAESVDEFDSKVQAILDSFGSITGSIDTSINPALKKTEEELDILKDDMSAARVAYDEFLKTDGIRDENGQVKKEFEEQANAFKEAYEKAINEVVTKYREFLNIVNQENNKALNIKANTEELERARGKVETYGKGLDAIKEKVQQEYKINGIVNFVGALGRLASAISSLQNIGKIIKDESLSNTQKAIKITTALSYGVLGLASAYKQMNDVLKISETLKIAQLAFHKKQALLLGAQTGEVGLLTAAKTKLTAATYALNQAMLTNPAIAVAVGIGITIAAVASAIAIIDKFTMSVKQADEAIDNYNSKVKQTQSNIRQNSNNITSLEEAKKEWETLSERAGKYNKTIDNLTEDEKARYFELSNLIAQYNDSAVAGYDEQGNAIIKNNKALEETIQLLKDKRQAEIDSLYGGEQAEKAGEGRQKKFKANQDNYNTINRGATNSRQQLSQILLKRGEVLSKALEKQQDQLSESQKRQWKELNEIISNGIDDIYDNRGRLLQIYKGFQDIQTDTPLLSIDRLQEQVKTSNDFNKKLQDSENERKDLIEQQRRAAIDLLQTSDYYQIFSKAEELGIEDGTAILDGIVSGINIVSQNGDLRERKDIAKDIKDMYSSILNTLSQSTEGGQSLYETMMNAVTMDRKISEGDFSSLKQQNDYIIKVIQKILQDNIKDFEDLSDEQKNALAGVFANIFNLEGLSIDFDEGKVDDVINSSFDTLLTRVNEIAEKKFSQGKNSLSGDWLSNLLPSDIDESTLNFITQNLDKQVEKTNNLALAIENLLNNAQPLKNLNENVGTAELLNKQASGENLGEKEQEALQKGLESLKDTYPGLIEQVEILQNKWLQGTSLYTQALSNVKGALIDSIGIGLKESNLTAEDAKEKIVALASNTEDLDRISNQYFENQQLKSQILSDSLIKIASGYDSCKKALGDYTLALGTANQSSAEFALKRSTESAEMAAAFGLDAQQVQDLAANFSQLAQQYEETGDASLKEYEGLNKNAQAAADAAVRYIRLNDAIEDMQQNYDDMTTLLSELSSAHGDLTDILVDNEDAFKSLKKDIAGIINVSEDMINEDWYGWIEENAGKLQQAMNGSQEAIDALRDSATEEILLHLNVDTSALGMSKQQIADWAINLPEGELDVDDTLILQKLTWLMQEAGYTSDQIRAYFKGMDLDVDLEPMNQSLQQAMTNAEIAGSSVQNSLAFEATETSSTSTAQDAKNDIGFSENVTFQRKKATNYVMQQAGSTAFGLPIIDTVPVTSTIVQAHKTVEEVPIQATAIKENTTQALGIKRAGKLAGGKISHKNVSGGNKNGGGGGGKNKGKGRNRRPRKSRSSSSPKAETPKQPKVQKAVKDTQDRYHDVNLKLKDVDNQLGKVQQKQQKLTGPSLLKNLEKQQKLLDKQVTTYKEKLQIEKQEADEVRNRLIKDGVFFNADGSIANYSTALSKALADYNKVIKEYNSMSAEDQQKNKDMLDSAKQKYENFKNDISRYDKITSEEIPNLQKSIRADLDKKTELQIQQFKLKVELELDSTQAEKDFKEFRNKVVKQLRDDDVLGQAKALKSDYGTYYKSGYDVIQSLTDQVRKTQRQIAIIDERGSSAIYGNDRAAALKDLKEYTDQLMKNLENVEDIVNDIKETIFDAIDKAQDAFDEQRKQYEQIGDLIKHHQKVVQLLYGEDAYNALDKYYKLQQKNNKSQLDFLSKQKDLWYARMKAQQKTLNSLPKGSNEWKEANQRFEQYKKHWMDSLNDLNDLIEDSLDVVIDRYLNKIDKYFNDLENKLTKNKGFQHLGEEWELINKQADMYLDQVNSMYETDKLENAYKDAIKNNEGNVKAQKSLTNMMNEQLKYLKDKDKLTQYDVDRANALLQIEIKRLALESQRQNKTKLRLRRDAQGNYTYQYTADEQAQEQSQQELADAQNSLYNMTKQAYKNNLDSYYDTVTEWQDKVKDVYKDTTLTVDEQQKKVALLNEYYGDIINGMTKNNEDLKKFMMQDTFDEMAKMYDTNVENYHAMTQAQKNAIMSEMVPYWKSGIQEMADSVTNSNTGFLPLTTSAFNKIAEATKKYSQELQAVKKYNDETFKDTKDNIDINITRTQDLLEKNDDLIKSYRDELKGVQQVINQVQKLTQTYKKAKDEAIEATTAAYNFQQKDAKKVTEPGKTKAQTQKEQIQREYNSTISDMGFYLKAGQDPLQIFTQKMSSLGATSASNRQSIDQKRISLQQEIDKYINQYLSEQQRANYLKNRKNISSYATGGYTGNWGEDGKLAVLHQKELILNEQDTKHMLSAVSIVRTLDNILEGFKFDTTGMGNNNIISSLINRAEGASAGQQYITINADFPAVKDRLQIEAAFDNLVNRASQFAFSNRK